MRIWVILLWLLLAGCLRPVKEIYPEEEEKRPVEMFLVDHGWHAGIIIESSYIRHLLPEHPEMPEARYLKFGWGDGRYYTDRDAGVRKLMMALFLPTHSVLHVMGIDLELDRYFSSSSIVKVNVTEEGVLRFADFVLDRLVTDEEGGIQKAADGIYTNSVFFKARGRYYFPKTSNTWTARALRQTGFPISPIYTITSGNVMRQARRDGEVVQ